MVDALVSTTNPQKVNDKEKDWIDTRQRISQVLFLQGIGDWRGISLSLQSSFLIPMTLRYFSSSNLGLLDYRKQRGWQGGMIYQHIPINAGDIQNLTCWLLAAFYDPPDSSCIPNNGSLFPQSRKEYSQCSSG